jgi:hypothetical protein
MQRSRWAILWAVVLILGGGFLLAQNLNLIGPQFQPPIWTILLGGLGLLFLLNAITTLGEEWWAFIPGCVLLGVAAVIWLEQQHVKDEWIGSLMLFSVAVPFLLIYALKRGSFWWALIPGGILAIVAVIPILTLGVPGEAIGTFVMWVIALGFLIVYLANRKNWWALIPSGVMFVIGIMPLLAMTQLPGQFIGGVFFVGLAAVFCLIYLINLHDPEMHWALYPAAVLLAVGIGVMLVGQNWWPLVLIGLGAALLIRAIWPRK